MKRKLDRNSKNYVIILMLFVISISLYMLNKDIGITLFFFILASILFLFNYNRFGGDCFNPDSLFYSVWFTTIGLYQLNLSITQYVWNSKMWGVIVGSTLAFSMGSLLGELFPHRVHSNYKTSDETKSRHSEKYNFKLLNKVLKYAYLISLIAFVIEVIYAGAIPILNRKFGNYTNFGIPYVHYLVISIGILLVLTYYSFIHYKKKDKSLNFLFWIGWLALVSMLNRHVILFTLIGILLVKNFCVKKISLKNVLIVLSVSLVGFSIFGSLRNVTPEHLYLYGGFKKEMPMIFMWVYYYLTAGFSNLYVVINEQISLGWGLQTFTPLWTFTGLKSMFDYAIHPNFSGVGTFLEGYYIDFGIVGIILFPFILGIASKISYIKIKSEKYSLITFAIYFCIVNELIFLFFTDYFSYTHIPLQVIVAVIIHFFSKRKSIKTSS